MKQHLEEKPTVISDIKNFLLPTVQMELSKDSLGREKLIRKKHLKKNPSTQFSETLREKELDYAMINLMKSKLTHEPSDSRALQLRYLQNLHATHDNIWHSLPAKLELFEDQFQPLGEHTAKQWNQYIEENITYFAKRQLTSHEYNMLSNSSYRYLQILNYHAALELAIQKLKEELQSLTAGKQNTQQEQIASEQASIKDATQEEGTSTPNLQKEELSAENSSVKLSSFQEEGTISTPEEPSVSEAILMQDLSHNQITSDENPTNNQP